MASSVWCSHMYGNATSRERGRPADTPRPGPSQLQHREHNSAKARRCAGRLSSYIPSPPTAYREEQVEPARNGSFHDARSPSRFLILWRPHQPFVARAPNDRKYPAELSPQSRSSSLLRRSLTSAFYSAAVFRSGWPIKVWRFLARDFEIAAVRVTLAVRQATPMSAPISFLSASRYASGADMIGNRNRIRHFVPSLHVMNTCQLLEMAKETPDDARVADQYKIAPGSGIRCVSA